MTDLDHDALCPCINKGDKRWCECALIAKVRADEREQYQGRRDSMMRALTEELLNVRTDLRAKVEALPEPVDTLAVASISRADVLALLDGADGA